MGESTRFDSPGGSHVGDELVNAVQEMAAYLRGEIECENYEYEPTTPSADAKENGLNNLPSNALLAAVEKAYTNIDENRPTNEVHDYIRDTFAGSRRFKRPRTLATQPTAS